MGGGGGEEGGGRGRGRRVVERTRQGGVFCSPQWLPLDAHTLLDVLQEVRGRLSHHVLHSEPGLWEGGRERGAGFTMSHTHSVNVSTFRYSVNRFMKPMKCSALRMFPGMASADGDRQRLARLVFSSK